MNTAESEKKEKKEKNTHEFLTWSKRLQMYLENKLLYS